MTGKKWLVGGKSVVAAVGLVYAAVAAAPADAWAAAIGLSPESHVAGAGFIALFFLAAAVMWVSSVLRKARRTLHRHAFISSALNNLNQGVVMTDSRQRIILCNDRYLELYGLLRSDIRPGMTDPELCDLRRARGVLDACGDQFYPLSNACEGLFTELSDGRLIAVKRFKLPNGGSVATHEDCSEQRKLARQLATTKQFLESVIDNVPVCIAAKSIEDGRYILVNRAFERFSRFSRDFIVGRRADEIFNPRTAANIAATDQLALASSESHYYSEMVFERGSEKRTLANNKVVARNEAGQPAFLIALFEDVTERKSLSRELENAKKFLETVVDNIPVSLIVQCACDGHYLLANRRAETILNRRREDAIGLAASDIFSPREAGLIVARDETAVRKGGLSTEEHPISTSEGLRLFLTRRVTVPGDDGEPQYLIKTHEDVTDRRQTESRMAHMAYHDGLTDLPNRTAFLKALSQMIEACQSTGEEFAVLSLDLAGLKEINDVFGQAIGDKLLIEVAHRIQDAAHGGVVARLNGDEFGLIIDGEQPAAGLALAEQLALAMAPEFLIEEKSIRTGFTTGISLFPRDGTDPASLLANAGVALFRAKAKSRGSIGVFEPEMDRQIRDRRVLLQDLSNAVRNGELSLHYQPQARTGRKFVDGDVTGFEALARWMHPTRGFVSPGDFIPLAEESGLIVAMGEWILREACREAASWPKPKQIAVNLSPAQFIHGDLVGLVHSILLETGLNPNRLALEITEGVLIEDFERGVALLRRLKALGVRISMDDFGSGYSSLTYLQAFPFDKIKIDRAFVMHLGRNPQSAAIVRAVIGLGHGLGVSIVAEGVETQEQLGFLADEGCDAVQGFFIGKPAPIVQYATLVGRLPPIPEAICRKVG